MTDKTKRMKGIAWERRRAAIFADSRICHICGHDGSDAIDHVVPLDRGGTNHITNLKPAHHTLPCETCGKKCNRLKSNKEFAPIVRDSGSLRRPSF